MALTVLLDLDETLLKTNMEVFLPEYFSALAHAFSFLTSKETLIKQIHYAVKQMTANQNPGLNLRKIFSDNFYQPLGTTEEDCQVIIDRFYKADFPKLQKFTQKKPEASELVNWCLSNDMTLAIATNPLFPKQATRQRIDWAGLNPDDFTFFSTYQDFHFTKPNLAYYTEAIGRLGWPDQPTVMIGDDVLHDLLPMEKMGFRTFWITSESGTKNRPFGSISDVRPWLKKQAKQNHLPQTTTPEVLMAILRSTPAVLDAWLMQTSKEYLSKKPTQYDWSFAEILSHLTDMEINVYLPQWNQFLSDTSIPNQPINTSQRAENRLYQNQNPREAFRKFLNARQKSLSHIQELLKRGLIETSVQHAIYNTATIKELVKFSANHDQQHICQWVNLRKFYKIY